MAGRKYGKKSMQGNLDPQRYSCIQTEQQELKKQYSSHITMARICPYCQNKLEILCKGNHGAVYVKCPHCGEQVFFRRWHFDLTDSKL